MINKRIEEATQTSPLGKNLPKWIDFISWCRWYPDLFLDLIKPKKNTINLDLDQRVLLRCIVRFFSTYGTLPRGAGKTFIEQLAMFLICIFFPNISLSMTAQTKENAAAMIKDKFNEIMDAYPLLKNEIKVSKLPNDNVFIKFKNESSITNLANSNNSKGLRRKRITVEEAALLNNEIFEDCLLPIVEVPRRTVGKLSIVDPCELNQQINFFTTSGFRNSDEWRRSIAMYQDMINLKGKIVIGSNWMLACWAGRGSTKSQILDKRKNMSHVAFAQNYESEWVGAGDGSLVSMNKLMECRVLTEFITKPNENDEYYLGVDVARSRKESNNQSSIVVLKVNRNISGTRISSVDVVNIIKVPNILSFTEQARVVKRIQLFYKAKAVTIDANGLGVGLEDELLKEQYDNLTGRTLPCWDTINVVSEPEIPNSPKMIYSLKAQTSQSEIVTNFISYVDAKRIRFLERKQDSDFSEGDWDDFDNKIRPYFETDSFFEEVSNLKLVHNSRGVSIEQSVKKIDKDRVSALIYVLYYIDKFANEINDSTYDFCCLVN